jgi:hypothetical protein
MCTRGEAGLEEKRVKREALSAAGPRRWVVCGEPVARSKHGLQ